MARGVAQADCFPPLDSTLLPNTQPTQQILDSLQDSQALTAKARIFSGFLPPVEA
jgi:hypothetical protein